MDLTIIIGPEADTALRQLQAVTAPLKEELTYYDSSMRWVVRMRMEKDGTNNGFHPGLTDEEALEHIFSHINSLDWVLSRYELKGGAG